MNALLVKDEAPRSQALEQKDQIFPEADPALSELVLLAAQICETPVAMVWTLDEDGVRLRASVGVATKDLSVESLPCMAVMEPDAVFEIPDARLEPQFAPDGLLMEGQPFPFYAAVPLTTSSGEGAGALAVMDIAPRRLTEAQAGALNILARQATDRLEWQGRLQQMTEAASRKQRELDELAAENQEMADVLDSVSTLLVVLDAEGRIVHFNKACETASGYTAASLAGCCPWEYLIPEDAVPAAIESFERLKNGEFPSTFESEWLSQDGGRRRIAWCATDIRDAAGEILLIVTTGTDVMTRTPVPVAVLGDEERYRQLIEGSLGVVFTHDLDGQLLTLNAHGAASIGRTVEEMVGSPLEKFVPPKRRNTIREYLKTVTQNGQAQGVLHLLHSNGDVRMLAYRNRLVTDPDEIPYVLGFGVDITDQVKAERKLRTLTRQSNSILESVGDGIFCIDREGKVTVVNAAAAQMLGYRQEEMLGRVMHPLIHHTKTDGSSYPLEESPIRKSISSFGTARVRDEVFWRPSRAGSGCSIHRYDGAQSSGPDEGRVHLYGLP